jgi:hypothetical protein
VTAPKSDLVKRAVRLRKDREAIKVKLAKVETQLAAIEPKVLEWLQENGFPRISHDGVTLYIRRELWASLAEGVEIEFLKDAIAATGHDPALIVRERANAQTLSAFVREFDARGEPLPNSLAAAVKVSETFKLGFLASPDTKAKRPAGPEADLTSLAA